MSKLLDKLSELVELVRNEEEPEEEELLIDESPEEPSEELLEEQPEDGDKILIPWEDSKEIYHMMTGHESLKIEAGIELLALENRKQFLLKAVQESESEIKNCLSEIRDLYNVPKEGQYRFGVPNGEGGEAVFTKI